MASNLQLIATCTIRKIITLQVMVVELVTIGHLGFGKVLNTKST